MDRYDESKRVDDSEEDSSSARSTEILGLGGAPVPKMPGDPSASDDPESIRRRRERARETEESTTRREEGDKHGATGIDMGAGRQGTDLIGE
jgi:hypothetical protein